MVLVVLGDVFFKIIMFCYFCYINHLARIDTTIKFNCTLGMKAGCRGTSVTP